MALGKAQYNVLKNNNDLELAYIVAPPRMSYYMQYSTRIVDIYLKWFSIEDIYVYSIDEVFIDVTNYLHLYKKNAIELAKQINVCTIPINTFGSTYPNIKFLAFIVVAPVYSFTITIASFASFAETTYRCPLSIFITLYSPIK